MTYMYMWMRPKIKFYLFGIAAQIILFAFQAIFFY